jgi:DHA2 family multidrug resistance protein-like MFS transporter
MNEKTSSNGVARPWISLAVLILPALLITTDLTVLNFALPSIAKDLEPSATQQLWMLDGYGFALASLLLTMGSLGDRIGRRKVLLGGVLLFSIASVLAAYSRNMELLITARALQGIGGATVMPSSLALIRNLFDNERQRGTAVVIWSIALTTGVVIGPLIGGALLNFFWWGSVFLINVPFMVLLLILGPFLLPEFRDPNAGKLDLLSVLLSLLTVLPVIYGIKQMASNGYSTVQLIVIAVGVVFGVLFIIRQVTHDNPLIDVKLFKIRAYTGSVAANFASYLVLLGFSMFGTQYLQLVLGMNPLESALWTLPGALAASVAAPIVINLSRMMSRGYLITGGFLVSVIGFVLLAQLQTERNMLIYVAAGVVMTIGLSSVMTMITNMALGAVPMERAGAAVGIVETGQEFGGALGVAILGSIGAAVYRSDMSNVPINGGGSDAANVAHQTIGGAFTVARQLGGSAGQDLVKTASQSFVNGLHGAAWSAAVIAVVVAIVSAIALRDVGPEPAEQAPEADDMTGVPSAG